MQNVPIGGKPSPDSSGRLDLRAGMSGLCGMFEAQVKRTPAAPAVLFGERTVSYHELNAAANRLAHRLAGRGVKAEDAVGISLERSIEMIVAVLAILKARAAYVPLDPACPPERLRFMLEDSRPRIVLTEPAQKSRLVSKEIESIYLDDVWNSADGERSGNPKDPAAADGLAYLMYTSGSTGRPKAVVMEQGPLCNLLRWQMRALPGAARTLQFASLGFDVSFQEIFSTLLSGGLLVLVDEETRRDPAALLDFIEAKEIERFFVPFVALQQFTAAAEAANRFPARLRDVITAGEQLRITPQIRHFFTTLRECGLHNHYGPTESHVVTAHTLCGDPALWPAVAPIGRPIDGVRIHLLDESRKAVPAGGVGELYIGGPCLARGYLNRADLTAERFLRDPFGVDPGARLYRTGDRARLRKDGVLDFLGRNDDQIKIRGVRVEPGEIEAALSEHPGFQQVAVKGIDHTGQGHRLVVYYVGKGGASRGWAGLRTYLTERLPPSLLPSTFVKLDRMPLTPSGKVDRLALPPPAATHGEPAFPPRTEIEKQLVAIWETAFDVRPLGIRDNFLELGGDSLLAAQVAVSIEKEIRFRLPVGRLYEFPTIEKLAEHLTHKPKTNADHDVVVLNSAGTKPPLFSVRGSLNLGYHLGGDQPFVQLLPPLKCTSNQETAITELAEHCIRAMRAIQPHGPYCLSGYSFGGIVAFEVAHRLHLQGEKIALLALIEPDPPWPSPIAYLMRDIHRKGFGAALSGQLGRVLARLRRTFGVRPPETFAPGNGIEYRDMTPEQKMFSFPGLYRAPACPCPLTLFLAEGLGDDPLREPFMDPRLDWGKFAAHGSHVHSIPGDHLTINEEPNVHVLADLLRGCLGKLNPFATVVTFDAQITEPLVV